MLLVPDHISYGLENPTWQLKKHVEEKQDKYHYPQFFWIFNEMIQINVKLLREKLKSEIVKIPKISNLRVTDLNMHIVHHGMKF